MLVKCIEWNVTNYLMNISLGVLSFQDRDHPFHFFNSQKVKKAVTRNPT